MKDLPAVCTANIDASNHHELDILKQLDDSCVYMTLLYLQQLRSSSPLRQWDTPSHICWLGTQRPLHRMETEPHATAPNNHSSFR